MKELIQVVLLIFLGGIAGNLIMFLGAPDALFLAFTEEERQKLPNLVQRYIKWWHSKME